jgi:hypothetical protein
MGLRGVWVVAARCCASPPARCCADALERSFVHQNVMPITVTISLGRSGYTRTCSPRRSWRGAGMGVRLLLRREGSIQTSTGNRTCNDGRLYRNFNDIRVRSFILTGAPTDPGTSCIQQIATSGRGNATGNSQQMHWALTTGFIAPCLPTKTAHQARSDGRPALALRSCA